MNSELVQLSIIIPTYNRKDSLASCLNALFSQTVDKACCEIIVVDDGSTDGTEGIVQEIALSAPIPIRYFHQENRGPATARNFGLCQAKGRLALFMGDDIIATPSMLEHHIRTHEQNPEDQVAVLGHVTWRMDSPITPLMRWLEQGGPQFSFHQIADPGNAGYQYFYTSNISVKRKFLLENGLFDEDFRQAAGEDSELAYRLKKKGLRIIYVKDALGYHDHQVSVRSFVRRSFIVGLNSALLLRKHPEIADLSSLFPAYKIALKKIAMPFFVAAAELIDRLNWPKHAERLYGWIYWYYFFLGFSQIKDATKPVAENT